MRERKGERIRAIQQSKPELRAAYEKRRAHSIVRVQQRYGLEMTVEDYEALCRQMPDDATEEKFMARRIPDAREKGKIQFYAAYWRRMGIWLFAAYSLNSFQIVTFYPPEQLPRDLPPSSAMEADLRRGAEIHHLREKLSGSPRTPLTVEGEIAWALLGMEAPSDVVQAKMLLKMLGVSLDAINFQINGRLGRQREMEAGEYKKWLDSARWAAMWQSHQIEALKAYVALMEQRARRMAGIDTTEALLAGVVELVKRLDYEKRADFHEGEFKIVSASKQHLWDLGWGRESARAAKERIEAEA